MTTICYRDGVIAYDSRETKSGVTVSTDDADKCIIANGVRFFVSGSYKDAEHLVSSYFDAKYRPPRNCDIGAFIVDGEQVLRGGINIHDGFWKHPAHNVNAIGSGQDHAFTAMDMGADAKTAVKMAAKRDTNTGGRIRTFKIK